MELRQLRYFIAVADTLNFSRAAESLYISQSALSKQVSDLEKELEADLFIRDKHSVELTEAGKLLRDEARELLLRAEKLAPSVKSLSGVRAATSSLYIGTDAKSVADPDLRKTLAEVIYSMRRSHPGLRARFRFMDYQALMDALLEGAIDVAILLDGAQLSDSRFTTRLLWTEEMVLVLRGDRQYSQKDIPELLKKQGIIMLNNENRGMAQIMRILDDIGVEADIRFCDDRNAMSLTMESGECAAMLPLSVVSKLNNPELQIFKLGFPSTKMYLNAVWRAGRDSQFVLSLLEDVDKYMKKQQIPS